MGTNYSTAFGPYPLVAQAPGQLDVLETPYLQCPHDLHLVVQSRLFEGKEDSVIMCMDEGTSVPYARVQGSQTRRSRGEGNVIETPDGHALLSLVQVSA